MAVNLFFKKLTAEFLPCISVFGWRKKIFKRFCCRLVSGLDKMRIHFAGCVRRCVSEPFRNRCYGNTACNLQGSVCVARVLLNSVGAISPEKDFSMMERPGLQELNTDIFFEFYISPQYPDGQE